MLLCIGYIPKIIKYLDGDNIMPLYVFKCDECTLEFEQLLPYDDRDEPQVCPNCNSEAPRKQVTSFGISSKLDPKKDTIHTPKEIDKVVGAAAEKSWEGYNEKWKGKYEERRAARWKGKKTKEVMVDSPSPVMELGSKKEKDIRKEATEALQEHRAERVKKGIPQFDGPGSIEES